jgi:hypothetical protein
MGTPKEAKGYLGERECRECFPTGGGDVASTATEEETGYRAPGKETTMSYEDETPPEGMEEAIDIIYRAAQRRDGRPESEVKRITDLSDKELDIWLAQRLERDRREEEEAEDARREKIARQQAQEARRAEEARTSQIRGSGGYSMRPDNQSSMASVARRQMNEIEEASRDIRRAQRERGY